MRRRGRGDIFFALVLILMIGGGSVFVWTHTRPVPTPPMPFQGGTQSLSAPFYMVPLTMVGRAGATTGGTGPAAAGSQPATDVSAARAAWKDFVDNVASDPLSVRLVGRMYGGLPAEIVVLDAAAARAGGGAMFAVPSPGHSVVLRIGSLSEDQMTLDRRALLRPQVSVGTCIFVRDKNETIGGPGYFPSGSLASLDEELTVLADDYFQRHGRPFVLRYSGVTPELLKNATAARKELDKKIQKLSDQAEQMYGGLKPR